MSKICAGIVTYNPESEMLQKNIEAIRSQVEHVFIVDNGSKNQNEWIDFMTRLDISVICNDSNRGIATALNQLCRVALDNEYDWIITLDQDSLAPPDLVELLYEHADKDVAVVAPNIIYKGNEQFAERSTCGIETVQWVITSASLTNLIIWNKMGGFDEELFIDGVDRDYCIRATRSGYKVLKDYDVELLHILGDLKCRKCFGKVIYVTNHSPKRKYFMARNVVYLDKKLNLNDAPKYILRLLIKTVLYEDNKLLKIRAVFKGTCDAKRKIK